MARTSAYFSNGSSDSAIVFTSSRAALEGGVLGLETEKTPCMVAAADATDGATLDSHFVALHHTRAHVLR